MAVNAHFARFTTPDSSAAVWVNPAHVIAVQSIDGEPNRATLVLANQAPLVVKGSPADVARRLRGVSQPES